MISAQLSTFCSDKIRRTGGPEGIQAHPEAQDGLVAAGAGVCWYQGACDLSVTHRVMFPSARALVTCR